MKKTAIIQGEKYNQAQLFLIDTLEVECLPKARVIVDAYEIAEWLESYVSEIQAKNEAIIEKQEELIENLTKQLLNPEPTTHRADEALRLFGSREKTLREELTQLKKITENK